MTTATATKIFADRIGRIEVSATMAITAAALKLKAEGVNLADFGAGERHFSTPRHIKDAAIEAIERTSRAIPTWLVSPKCGRQLWIATPATSVRTTPLTSASSPPAAS